MRESKEVPQFNNSGFHDDSISSEEIKRRTNNKSQFLIKSQMTDSTNLIKNNNRSSINETEKSKSSQNINLDVYGNDNNIILVNSLENIKSSINSEDEDNIKIKKEFKNNSDGNNNELNSNFNRTTPSINNNNINTNNNRTSMSQVGEKLIYNNTFNNNVVNKEVYKQPLTGFQNYYLNNDASNAYDNIKSKKKINLINDYLSSKKQTEDEYITEQYGLKENNINNSNGRLNDLMNKISDITTENRLNGKDLFNKRNQYATLFDDKKLAEYSYNRQQNLKNLGANNNIITENDFTNYQMNRVINGKKSPQRLQHYTPFSRLGKVYTTVLPTSSSAYGACYHNNEINNGDQSPNRLYY